MYKNTKKTKNKLILKIYIKLKYLKLQYIFNNNKKKNNNKKVQRLYIN